MPLISVKDKNFKPVRLSNHKIYNNPEDCFDLVIINKWQQDELKKTSDKLALETPIALVYNGISHVVMMATPHELEQLALGFSLSEGIIDSIDQLYAIDTNIIADGIELNIEIYTEKFVQLKHWRRNQTGRTGCGICGAESLQQAIKAIKKVNDVEHMDSSIMQKAILSLSEHQYLQQQTGATHCAAWFDMQGEMLKICEDVGRHNALDKLIGHLVQQQLDLSKGVAIISSRASYEMVSKACQVGISRLAAVSAPTSLACKLARNSGLRLIGFARKGRFNIYC